MYQVIIHKYGAEIPEGTTFTTTDALEEFIHELDLKSLVYVEVRYVRSIRKPRRPRKTE